MSDVVSSPSAIALPPGRRQALRLLALLLLAPALAACKEVQPGSGLETIRHKQRHDGGPGGK
jgi:hypothetical protein